MDRREREDELNASNARDKSCNIAHLRKFFHEYGECCIGGQSTSYSSRKHTIRQAVKTDNTTLAESILGLNNYPWSAVHRYK